jgi:beta-lactamase regulating signal transducer with metallopeptidase domain
MDHPLLITDALRCALVLAAALLAMPLLRRAASSTRRLVLALGLAAALGLPALSAVLPAWHVEAPSLALPLRGKLVGEPSVPGGGPATARASTSAITPAVFSPSRIDGVAVVVWVWALGALLLVARLAASLARARAVARRAAPASGWERARVRAEVATGVRVEVRETSELDAPAVWGVLSPVVLVPRAATEWPELRRDHVLLHEMAHVRRRDCLVQIVADLSVAIHWIDPLAWLCARRLRVERELAADDSVLEHGARPSSYAEDLLAVAGARPAPAGALGMAEPARLVTRVRAVLAKGRHRAPLGSAKTAALVGAASSIVLALACTSPTGAASGSPARTTAPPAVAAPDSSIDPAIQAIADEELDRTLRQWSAPAGVVVVLDATTGQVLADAGRDRGARADLARLHPYFPGSTLKVVVLVAALEAGVVSPTDSIDCEHGGFQYAGGRVADNGSYGVLPLPQAVAVSSNVAAAKLFDRVGGDRFGRALRALHFGEAPGRLPDRIDDHSMVGATAAMGEGVTATPLQVAAAYVAIASGGSYVEPTLSARAQAARREPVMKPETAHAMMAILDEVVNSERGTGKRARVAGARVAGKTGTSSWDLPGGGEGIYASFVGIVPEESPRFVILVGVEQPKNDGDGVGGWNVAAPAFARIATSALALERIP